MECCWILRNGSILGKSIPLAMGYLNAIWQADAASMSLQSLSYASTPPFVINIAGPDLILWRIAAQFGERCRKPARFEGMESGDALLNNAQKAFQLFGYPLVGVESMVSWIADWIARGERHWRSQRILRTALEISRKGMECIQY